MDLADYYRVLGLRAGAPYLDIKAAYRRLARQYHPDANPEDGQAQEKFIRLTEAYKKLLAHVPPEPEPRSRSTASQAETNFNFRVKITKKPQGGSSGFGVRGSEMGNQGTATASTSEFHTQDATQGKTPNSELQTPNSELRTPNSELSEAEFKLKQQSYGQLQQFLKGQRFPRAIALIEGLAQRLPDDLEVRQWQAITYQRWGRQLINQKEFDKARVYLKKALKVDPHNKTLWAEVDKEFQRLEQAYKSSSRRG
jgi:curved DNA-binding protein CbpA